MKRSTELTRPAGVKATFLFVFIFCSALLTSIRVFAQSVPDKVDVDINTNGGTTWYGQPWVWAIGVAIFIVVIVAITRKGNRNA